jgi:hypothetical protein
MKQIETKPKELYEAPSVLDISPVTVNVVAGDSTELDEDEYIDDSEG